MTWIALIDRHADGIGALLTLALIIMLLCVLAWSNKR